jgi:hypothetical protein
VLTGLEKDVLLTASRYLAPVVLAVALAGCGSIGAVGVPWKRSQPVAQQQAPLPPPMPAPIETADLAPLDGTASGGVGSDGFDGEPLTPPPGSQLAMTAPSGSAVGRTDLLGGWTITAAGDSCQLFMTLTSWTGGYRASTRGCTSDLLKSISAWNLQGGEVVLAGQGGSPVARLASSGSNRFDGQANGQLVSFYR